MYHIINRALACYPFDVIVASFRVKFFGMVRSQYEDKLKQDPISQQANTWKNKIRKLQKK